MKSSFVTIALLSALSATASAEGFYWGGAVGQSYSNLCPSTDLTKYSCARTGDSFSVAGGYNFTPYFGVEANYDVLGSYAAYDGGSSGSDGAATSYTKINAIVVAATATSPEIIKNTFIIGRLGVAGLSLTQPTATATNTASNTNIEYGLGLQYNFAKSVAGRALWENFGSVGNASTSTSPMSLITLGLIFIY